MFPFHVASLHLFLQSCRSPGGPVRKRDYSPLSWKQYFENSEYVCVSDKNVSFLLLSVLGS